jgi:uncharacterized protein (DUF1330 family)
MSVYIIAQVEVHDRATYKQYVKGFLKMFGNFRGQVLVGDEQPKVLEGSWMGNRTVIIRFDDEAEALRWYQSEDYQAAMKFRVLSATTNLILAQGLDAPA